MVVNKLPRSVRQDEISCNLLRDERSDAISRRWPCSPSCPSTSRHRMKTPGVGDWQGNSSVPQRILCFASAPQRALGSSAFPKCESEASHLAAVPIDVHCKYFQSSSQNPLGFGLRRMGFLFWFCLSQAYVLGEAFGSGDPRAINWPAETDAPVQRGKEWARWWA